MKKFINLNIISWLLGITFYFSIFSYLLSASFLNAFLFFILAIITFPPSFSLLKKYIKKHYNFSLGDIHRLFVIILLFIIFNFLNPSKIEKYQTNSNTNNQNIIENIVKEKPKPINYKEEKLENKKEQILDNSKIYYNITKVVDGDTIKVDIDNQSKTIRLIGIDTPETVHPEKPVECFGKEASLKLKELLNGRKVYIENDPTQNNTDIYSRLLRYVYRDDGLFINKWMVENGYAYEYTYKIPYIYQKDFKEAENKAKNNKLGLWADGACDNFNSTKEETPNKNCLIKGNISYTTKEKIYHTPTCDDYAQTVINQDKGERWFCTEEEAVEAGWRKAKNCF